MRSALYGPKPKGPLRILFSAHGLPKKIVTSGDPYQWQIEQTAAAVVEEIGVPSLDWVVCYQSRVGPLAWLSPYTEDEQLSCTSRTLGNIRLSPRACVRRR